MVAASPHEQYFGWSHVARLPSSHVCNPSCTALVPTHVLYEVCIHTRPPQLGGWHCMGWRTACQGAGSPSMLLLMLSAGKCLRFLSPVPCMPWCLSCTMRICIRVPAPVPVSVPESCCCCWLGWRRLPQDAGRVGFNFRNLAGNFHPLNFAVDPRLYSAAGVTKTPIKYDPRTAAVGKPSNDVPGVVHVHGLVAPSEFDGVPYFTLTTTGRSLLHKFKGISNPPALALYHDHSWGFTRLSV